MSEAKARQRDGAWRVLDHFAWLRLFWVDGGIPGDGFAQWIIHGKRRLSMERRR